MDESKPLSRREQLLLWQQQKKAQAEQQSRTTGKDTNDPLKARKRALKPIENLVVGTPVVAKSRKDVTIKQAPATTAIHKTSSRDILTVDAEEFAPSPFVPCKTKVQRRPLRPRDDNISNILLQAANPVPSSKATAIPPSPSPAQKPSRKQVTRYTCPLYSLFPEY